MESGYKPPGRHIRALRYLPSSSGRHSSGEPSASTRLERDMARS